MAVLATSNTREVNLVNGKLHVLGDSPSRIPHRAEMHHLQFAIPSYSEIEDVLSQYEADQCFGPIVAAMKGRWPEDPKHRKRLEVMLPSFSQNGWRLLCKGKLCVLSKYRRQILDMAHDSKVAGHFAFSKTLARLAEFHRKHKTKGVKQYLEGCSTCQQQKEYIGQILMIVPHYWFQLGAGVW